MNLSDRIQPGMTKEQSYPVAEENAALTVGSGGSRVLATPWMIAFMERVSHRLLCEHLPEGWSSVGIEVDVRHLAPTPVGSTVQVRCRVREVDGLRVLFEVEAWDAVEKVGEGLHRRMAIDEARFLRRVNAKREAIG
jgi:predicted thioesterase